MLFFTPPDNVGNQSWQAKPDKAFAYDIINTMQWYMLLYNMCIHMYAYIYTHLLYPLGLLDVLQFV